LALLIFWTSSKFSSMVCLIFLAPGRRVTRAIGDCLDFAQLNRSRRRHYIALHKLARENCALR
jgi:hypothetical protein